MTYALLEDKSISNVLSEMAVNVNKFGRYQCPCCGYYTFRQEPTGEYAICSVCYWEDDPIQGADPTYAGGANAVSLHQAQQNFREVGASDPDCLAVVRKPNREELPDELTLLST